MFDPHPFTPPFQIALHIGSTKNRKDARQYIQTDLAAELQAHITTKAPAAPVFTMPTKYNVARMFRQDLADARRAWLAAAVDADDRMTREQSDFLGYRNHDGERADFHALRHTCGAWLAMAGNHPKAVQSIMRHSSITLTMDTYGHLFPGAEADAVARLPVMLGDAPQALAATGTDANGTNMAANRQQCGSETSTIVARSCESSDDDRSVDGQRNLLTFNALSGTRQEAAELGGSEVAGARTQGLRIKSLMANPENAREKGVRGLPASKSPAVAAEIPQDLQALIDAWPALPDAIKAGILAMVKAAGGKP